MPQGAFKSKKVATPSKVIKPKKAARRDIAPKKGVLVPNLEKKHSGILTASTEKLLSSRVGHLELLKGSRREIAKKEQDKARKAKAKGKPAK
ncbi:uncharacterized protein V1510DRAFT_412058 [Dipodascopsis tothii]|uniref:uncharacterized protein n=1 Tax=Dipodascopsis tothii TaxID=44089 RepID=UPI0034CF1CF2